MAFGYNERHWKIVWNLKIMRNPIGFEIRTEVRQSARQVFAGFDRTLFMQLRPPLMPFQLLRFDGCAEGDEVHIRMGLLGEWRARVIEKAERPEEIRFVDVGDRLPFPLKQWRHTHRILHLSTGGAVIVDHISYDCGGWIRNRLMYLPLKLLFLLRRPVYSRIFDLS